MSIKDNFCPKCGKPTEQPGLCTQCRIGSEPWFSCDNRVTHTECPSCGAMKQANTWTDTERTRAEIAPDLARTAVHFHEQAKKPTIEVVVEDLTVNPMPIRSLGVRPCSEPSEVEMNGSFQKSSTAGSGETP